MTSLMDNYSQGVVLEGDSPLDWVELEVYVLPSSAEALLVRRKGAPPKLMHPAAEAIVGLPYGLDRAGSRFLDGEAPPQRMAMTEEESEQLLALLGRRYQPPTSSKTVHWAIAEEYDGIEKAQLVVVNIRDEAEREHGEALLAEVARLRSDPEVFADVMRPRQGSKVAITAVVGDLTNPKDPGTKKALARVRRVFRSTSDW